MPETSALLSRKSCNRAIVGKPLLGAPCNALQRFLKRGLGRGRSRADSAGAAQVSLIGKFLQAGRIPEAFELASSAAAIPPLPSLAFAGSPEFACRALAALMTAGHRPRLVLTQPDRPAGRGRRSSPSAVKRLALDASIPVATPRRADAIEAALARAAPDLLIVAAYGLLLPAAALARPRLGCINVHASLLPRWRGAAPIERALIAGDEATGVSLMQMDEGLDTGPVLAQSRMPIVPRATGAALESALADLGARLLLQTLPILSQLTPRPQRGPATWAPKLGRQDAAANWRHSASELDRRIRALAHRLPVFGTLGEVRVQLLAATAAAGTWDAVPGTILPAGKEEILVACGEGALRLQALRLNRGKGNVLGPREARNGFPRLFHPGARFDGNRDCSPSR